MPDTPENRLSDEQLRRYSRQIMLPEVGVEGQRRLLRSSVLVVGAGGLGSPAAIYLAAAGVGTIAIVDADRVQTWNLHRQILHFSADVGRRKTASAADHLRRLNPDVRIVRHDTFLAPDNARNIIRPYDAVVNGCDNFPTRYLLNDACVVEEKPLIDAGVLQFLGQASVFLPGQGCLRCLFPAPPPPEAAPSCSAVGVLGALPGHMGTLQATETLKLLLGAGKSLANRFLLYDALDATYRSFDWDRDSDCPTCGDEPQITDPAAVDYEDLCGAPVPAEDDPNAPPADFFARRADWEIGPERLLRWKQKGDVRILDVRTAAERRAARIPESTSVPLDELREMAETERPDPSIGDPAQRIAVYCQIGERSATAVHLLQRMGYAESFSLRSGIIGWSNAGGRILRGAGDA